MSTPREAVAPNEPLNDNIPEAGSPNEATKQDLMADPNLLGSKIFDMDEERRVRVASRRHPDNVVKRGLHKIVPYGGLLASGFSLACSSLGAGIIALPSAFNIGGMGMAMIYLVVVAVLTIYSFHLLGIAGKRTGLRNYEQITAVLMGKGGDYLVALMMFLLSFGAEISYVMAMGNVVTGFITFSDSSPEYLRTKSGQRLITSIVWLVGMLPLTLPKEINSLRHIAIAAVIFIVYFVICMIVHSATHGLKNGVPPDLVYFETGNRAIQALPIFMFAYICQINAFEVYEEMHKPRVNRFTMGAGVGVVLCFVLYFCSGFFGYVDFGRAVSDSVLTMYDPISYPYMGVAYAGIVLKLCVGFGMHMIPVRDAIYHVAGLDVKTIAWWKNAVICGFVATVALVCGLFIPKINMIFGLVGGLSGGFVGYIFPALLFMYSGNFNVESVGWVHFLGAYFMLIVGVIGVVWGTASSIFSTAVGS